MRQMTNLALISILLLGLVGPCFGPLLRYLASRLPLRPATGWLILVFLIAILMVIAVMRIRMWQDQQTFAELGWRQPSRRLAITLGLLMGLIWGSLGVMGFLRLQPTADPFEFSLFRLYTAVAGATIAIGEDLVTRGYVMGELQRLGWSSGWQILLSSLLFALYHTLWNFTAPGFVASLIYGAILGGLFILGRRSLTPVILAHSLALLIGEPFLTMMLVRTVAGGG